MISLPVFCCKMFSDNVCRGEKMSLYDMLWFFAIYSVIGWIIEVAYHAVTMGKVINRGFLNGPLCPVYGSGVLMVLTVLGLLGGDVEIMSAWVLFGVGIVFATLVEFIAGFLLDKLFHARWWDYRDRKFNLNGYICLEFSLIWGLAIAFVLRIVHPTFAALVDKIPDNIGAVLLGVFYIIFLVDVILTVMSVLKMNEQLRKMEELQKAILTLSDGMSEIIGEKTMKTVDKVDKARVFADKILDEIAEDSEAYKAEREMRREELEAKLEHIRKQIMYRRLFGTRRILWSNPNLSHDRYQETLEKLREYTKNIR